MAEDHYEEHRWTGRRRNVRTLEARLETQTQKRAGRIT